MNKYEIAFQVFEEYCSEVHWLFESPAERLAMWLWLMKKKNINIWYDKNPEQAIIKASYKLASAWWFNNPTIPLLDQPNLSDIISLFR